MKSVGEVMAIGRTFKEPLARPSVRWNQEGTGLRRYGLQGVKSGLFEQRFEFLRGKLMIPNPDRLWHIADAMRLGMSVDDIPMGAYRPVVPLQYKTDNGDGRQDKEQLWI